MEILSTGINSKDTIGEDHCIQLCMHRVPLTLLDIICDPEIFPNPSIPDEDEDTEESWEAEKETDPALIYLSYTLYSFHRLAEYLDAVYPSDEEYVTSEDLKQLEPYAQKFYSVLPKLWDTLWCEIRRRNGSTYLNTNATFRPDSATCSQIDDFLDTVVDLVSSIVQDNYNHSSEPKLPMTGSNRFLGHILIFAGLFTDDQELNRRYSAFRLFMDVAHRQDEARVEQILGDIFFSERVTTFIVDLLISDLWFMNTTTIDLLSDDIVIDGIALDFFGFFTCAPSRLPTHFEDEVQLQIGNIARVVTVACRQCLCRYVIYTVPESVVEESAVGVVGMIDGITGLERVVETISIDSVAVARKFIKQPETIPLIGRILLLCASDNHVHALCIERIQNILTKFLEAFIFLRTASDITASEADYTTLLLFQSQVLLVAEKSRINLLKHPPSKKAHFTLTTPGEDIPLLQYRCENYCPT
ncbi:hypothetical protein C8Q75DRAFT_379897 [Abortiporus biennis]|nr:hypothetical protein C8Q75DRAFT_379897 [Abortiporus biennis]